MKNNYRKYYQKLTVKICHTCIFSGYIELLFCLVRANECRDCVTDSLRYHVYHAKYIHSYDLGTEVFSFALGKLVLGFPAICISRDENK